MDLSRYKRNRFRLHVLDSTARTGQFKAVDPQYEQKIRGTQAWFYQSSGTTVDDAGSTVATQWPTSMQYEVALLGFGLTAVRSQALTKNISTYGANDRRETAGESAEFTPGRCRYD